MDYQPAAPTMSRRDPLPVVGMVDTKLRNARDSGVGGGPLKNFLIQRFGGAEPPRVGSVGPSPKLRSRDRREAARQEESVGALSILLASSLCFSTPTSFHHTAACAPRCNVSHSIPAGTWRLEWRTVLSGYDACGLPVYRRVLVRVWVPAYVSPRVARYRAANACVGG